MNETLKKIGANKLIAIIRENSQEQAYNTAVACIEGGISIIEITMNTAGALEIIRALKQNYPQNLVGAGTVIDVKLAELAINAGAEFIVSPHTDEAIIKYSKDNNIVVSAGTSTPSEMMNAYKCGADIIKVFPISNLGGVSFIKNVRAPLPFLKLMPTGGVDINNIQDFIKAGVFAIGLSRALIAREAVEAGNYFAIKRLAQEIIKKAIRF